MPTMELNTATLEKISLHYIGNKSSLGALHVADKELELDDETTTLLQEGLLLKFKNIPEQYSFTHASSLKYNEVYSYCKSIFKDKDNFEEAGGNIARQLYEASTHPKVKAGEFYVTYFEGLPVESRMHKAIGLFKTENKSLFLDVAKKGKNYSLAMKEATELTKIDKGCLIINRNVEEGYDVLLFDNQNRGEEAQYWKETFLGVTPQKNEFHHTNHFLTLTKQFITEQLDGEDVSKKEQLELLNKSLNYFKEQDSFDIDDFQAKVFVDDEIINSFRQFGSRYVESNDYDIASSFDISHDAVKKQAKVFKSVLKLDKNFHIYIHGRTDLIEKGVENDGRKYYKIYYQEEE